MLSVRNAIAQARKDVSPLCEVYSYSRKQWQFFWTSNRGREQSIPTTYEQARKARSARIAGVAAKLIAEDRELTDPQDAVDDAEWYVASDGLDVRSALRKMVNQID